MERMVSGILASVKSSVLLNGTRGRAFRQGQYHNKGHLTPLNIPILAINIPIWNYQPTRISSSEKNQQQFLMSKRTIDHSHVTWSSKLPVFTEHEGKKNTAPTTPHFTACCCISCNTRTGNRLKRFLILPARSGTTLVHQSPTEMDHSKGERPYLDYTLDPSMGPPDVNNQGRLLLPLDVDLVPQTPTNLI
jgi:hypothetical protein